MIEVDRLRKLFDELAAVDDISFTARRGEVFGLLGPNGAGKTTTLHCISTLLTPTAGRVRVNGHDVVKQSAKARASIGVVPQELALYEDLSAQENLDFWGGAQGMRNPERKRRVREVLELFGLQDRSKEPVKRFSGGMKRRLNFACGVVHGPKTLLLDEPTVGVDPQSRVRLLDLVREQARSGACVLYTTHYMEEAESLCDRLAIIDHGKLVAQGTLPELRAIVGARDLVRLTGSWEEGVARLALSRLDGVEIVQALESSVTIAAKDASARLTAIFEAMSAAGAEIRGTALIQPSLESVFIKLTGRELRE